MKIFLAFLLLFAQTAQYGTSTRFGSTQTLVAAAAPTIPTATNYWTAYDPANSCTGFIPCTANLQKVIFAHDSGSIGLNGLQAFGDIYYHTNQLNGYPSFDYSDGAEFAFDGTVYYFPAGVRIYTFSMWVVANLNCDNATVGNCTPPTTVNYGAIFGDRENTAAPVFQNNNSTPNLVLANNGCKPGIDTGCIVAESSASLSTSGYAAYGMTYNCPGNTNPCTYNFIQCTISGGCANIGSGTVSNAGNFQGPGSSLGASFINYTFLGQIVEAGVNSAFNGNATTFMTQLHNWLVFKYGFS